MGHRISKIYTRTGDDGTTGLTGGERVDKDSLRIETIGSVDELNSAIGMILAFTDDTKINDCLSRVQHQCFDLGGELSMPGYSMLQQSAVDELENDIDAFNATLEPLKNFILPAGGKATACCHMARSICRRAERHMVSLSRQESTNPASAVFLNRLSDLLFVLARIIVRDENGTEVLWQASSKPELSE